MWDLLIKQKILILTDFNGKKNDYFCRKKIVCYNWFTTMKSSSVHKVDKYPKLKELLPFIIPFLIVKLFWMVWFSLMMFNTTFINISVISLCSVLLVEETRVLRENHQPVASHWQTLSHNVVSSMPGPSGIQTRNVSDDKHYHIMFYWTVFKLTTLVVIGTDCIGSFKSNYHMVTTTTAPKLFWIPLLSQLDIFSNLFIRYWYVNIKEILDGSLC